jgi:hypothetical protein
MNQRMREYTMQKKFSHPNPAPCVSGARGGPSTIAHEILAINILRNCESSYGSPVVRRRSAKQKIKARGCFSFVVYVSLLIALAAHLQATCLAQSGQNKIDTDHSFASGIRVHCGGRTFDIDHIASGTDTQSIIFAGNRLDEGTVVCAVGYGINAKGLTMINPGFDPGNCVVFINTATGQFERTAYHTPRPDFLSSSPDGMYVGMASVDGWLKPDDIVHAKSGPMNGMSPAEVTRQLNDLVVGTMRYSVWKLPERVPLWEMRFYGESVADGAAARFERPWSAYAKLVLPWWAMNVYPSMFRQCQIDFSPDSSCFIALDPRHGVHVLRLDNGTQFHCCLASVLKHEKYPLFFHFSEESDELIVVFCDLSIRRVNLKTGKETAGGRLSLPEGAIAQSPVASNFFEVTNFAIDSRSGVIAFEQGNTLQLRSITPKVGHPDRREIHQIGTRDKFSRISLSADQRTVGIAYGILKNEFSPYIGRISMYEAADVKTGLIKRRLLIPESSENEAPNDGVATILANGEVAACLSPDGSDIIYAEPLDQP